MTRSARPADLLAPASGLLFEAAVAATGFLSRNPGVAGGTTAFLVAFLFVSANAAWYQPHRHPAPFFRTQAADSGPDAFARGATAERWRIERDGDERGHDPKIAFVQRALTDLDLYTGSIDGISGPKTRQAIETYRTRIGLDPAAEIDEPLLRALGDDPAPKPSPAPRAGSDRGVSKTAAAGREPDERIAAAQAGLKAVGYGALDIDGLMGAKTKTAIRDFQRKHKLAETGEVDRALLETLRKAGGRG